MFTNASSLLITSVPSQSGTTPLALRIGLIPSPFRCRSVAHSATNAGSVP